MINYSRVCLDNLNNVLALATQRQQGCSQRAVAARVEGPNDRGCRSLIRLGVQRMELYKQQNLKEALVCFRRGVRNDKLKVEWEDFAAHCWLDEDVSRKSEISKRVTRSPMTTPSKRIRWKADHYRLQYMFVPIKLGYKRLLAVAKEKYKTDPIFEGFHLSATMNSELRPFYVKDSCIESCLCIYRLIW